jgi:hypothetical protein
MNSVRAELSDRGCRGLRNCGGDAAAVAPGVQNGLALGGLLFFFAVRIRG